MQEKSNGVGENLLVGNYYLLDISGRVPA